MVMYEEYLVRKAHILVFETRSGSLLLATDNLEEVAMQEWFQEFLNVATMRAARYAKQFQPPMPVQAPLPPPPPQPVVQRSFLDLNPFQMKQEIWDSLSQEQQTQWSQKYMEQIRAMQSGK